MTANGVSPESVAGEFGEWLSHNWDPALPLRTWRELLCDSGWAVPHWPEEWMGRGLPAWSEVLVSACLRSHGSVGLPMGVGMSLAAPTILEHGDDALKRSFLRATVTGKFTWCQLFSEPGAGSDLAGLQARAVRDGDEWVVNGQKVWNTSAHHADYGILLARTDSSVAKHSGITYFVIPMRQPGVLVRPLAQMNHHSSFNEVFLTDARVPGDWVVGQVNSGWTVALATLAHERRFGNIVSRWSLGDASGRAVEEARAEHDEHMETYKWYPQRAGRVDLVVPEMQRRGLRHDAALRQEVARLLTMQRIAGWTADRARAARELGRPPGPEGSVGKLAMSEIARLAAHVHGRIAGAEGLLNGPDTAAGGMVAEVLVSVPGQSIAGGTDEIQRNILGERMLGLPREPR
ncbi:MAG: acyl-CoA dehydrogenase [Actinobacteria bacterium]|nr:acyl-CoA dehydrogenase [Actinomycetota bacterium]NBR67002.1 acyl-CoA dehydrogenase [Actinomycetota bacterium]